MKFYFIVAHYQSGSVNGDVSTNRDVSINEDAVSVNGDAVSVFGDGYIFS